MAVECKHMCTFLALPTFVRILTEKVNGERSNCSVIMVDNRSGAAISTMWSPQSSLTNLLHSTVIFAPKFLSAALTRLPNIIEAGTVVRRR